MSRFYYCRQVEAATHSPSRELLTVSLSSTVRGRRLSSHYHHRRSSRLLLTRFWHSCCVSLMTCWVLLYVTNVVNTWLDHGRFSD